MRRTTDLQRDDRPADNGDVLRVRHLPFCTTARRFRIGRAVAAGVADVALRKHGDVRIGGAEGQGLKFASRDLQRGHDGRV